jgi:hypothetical protein
MLFEEEFNDLKIDNKYLNINGIDDKKKLINII